jgi:hypothetical protein
MRKTSPSPNDPAPGQSQRDDAQRIRPVQPRRPSRRRHHPIHMDMAHPAARTRPWLAQGARPNLAALWLPMDAGVVHTPSIDKTFQRDTLPLAASSPLSNAHGTATAQLVRWLQHMTNLVLRGRCG